jgi:hypothetical protein
MIMTKMSHVLGAAFALATLATVTFATAPAEAAEVICKTGGAAQGCIAETVPVVVAPAAPVVVTTRAAYVAPAPVAVTHAGYTRVTPYGVKHVGYTRVWR